MNREEQDLDKERVRPAPTTWSKSRKYVVMICTVVVIAVLVVVSAFAFAQRGSSLATKQLPSGGTWDQVLSGYSLTAPVAAPSEPAILYVCATPLHPTGQNSTTVLRSTDFGSHWQNISANAGIGGSCDIAVNPNDSNDIYVTSWPGRVSTVKGPATVLRHSTDGGKTWTTVLPTLQEQGVQSEQTWFVQQLSMVGSRLFGVLWVTQVPAMNSQTILQPREGLPIARLVMSNDSGHSWTIVDGKFAGTMQGVRSYAVDTNVPTTIYEIVGGPYLLRSPGMEPNDPTLQPALLDGQLYKTTDGGATWTLLLKQVHFTYMVHLASDNSGLIYVGGASGPLPLASRSPDVLSPVAMGAFHLSMSRDGGASWRDAATLPQASSVQSWTLGPDGAVYVHASDSPSSRFVGSVQVSGDATGWTGMAPSGYSMGSSPSHIPTVTSHVATPTAQSASSIQRYDPGTNAWNAVTRTPGIGTLLTVTSAGGNQRVVFWFMGSVNGAAALYRYSA